MRQVQLTVLALLALSGCASGPTKTPEQEEAERMDNLRPAWTKPDAKPGEFEAVVKSCDRVVEDMTLRRPPYSILLDDFEYSFGGSSLWHSCMVAKNWSYIKNR